MAVVRYTKPVDFSKYSIKEASYMINSYIEESFNDLQVKCLLVENRSLRESGVGYFTEENEAGKEKLADKVKALFESVWKFILGVFEKVKEFFKNMIAKVKEFFGTAKKIKQLDEAKYSKFVKEADNEVFAKIVADKVDKYYDLDLIGSAIKDSTNSAKIGIYSDPTHIIENIESDRYKTKDITKQHVLDCAFGGFRKEYANVENAFKLVKDEFKKIENKADNATSAVDDKSNPMGEIWNFKSTKDSLKLLTKYSNLYAKCIINNSKQLVKVVYALEKEYNKKDKKAVGESVNWAAIF